MGSPIRVSGYDSTDSMTDGNHDATAAYLTYGYDEFGNDLARTIGKELEWAGISNPYTMQGEGQPFGDTEQVWVLSGKSDGNGGFGWKNSMGNYSGFGFTISIRRMWK